MKLGVVGCGYVGLVSAACFAEFGNNVVCAENYAARITALKKGEIPIYEPGLEEMVAANVNADRLDFGTDIDRRFADCRVIFLAVGTPTAEGEGREEADLSQLFKAAEKVAAVAAPEAVIVTKSTVPISTTAELQAKLDRWQPQKRLAAAANPEFLREGSALGDFIRPERVVIGIRDQAARKPLAEIYRPLAENGATMVFCDWESAELSKYAANAFLATKITFINEIADLCAVGGADIRQVALVLGLDKRIGGEFLEPGPGYGGACLPKDVRALVATAESLNSEVGLVDYVRNYNRRRKSALIERVKAAYGKPLAGKKVAVLGLTFKPNTDDLRESPAFELLDGLLAAKALPTITDPQASKALFAAKYADAIGNAIGWADDPQEALRDAEVAVLLTHWEDYRRLEPATIKELMGGNLFIDFRNVFEPLAAEKVGLDYRCLGIASGI